MNAEAPVSDNRWSVYIICGDDGRLYTGITTDIARRWREHSGTPAGAKYFRGRKPQRLCFLENGHDHSSAARREAEIKRLPRPDKDRLIAASPAPADFTP